MASYNPPSDDSADWDEFSFEDEQDEPNHEDGNPSSHSDSVGGLYLKWKGLHHSTKANLGKFEGADYVLNAMATGPESVRMLLGEINDIVRLSCTFVDEQLFRDETTWPLLTVEFDTLNLKNEKINGIYEFIDLPGIGERQTDDLFRRLLQTVANQVEACVPVLSPKEITHREWRELPRLASKGVTRVPLDYVVCTHLDQYEDSINEQVAKIVEQFWPQSPGDHTRVLACSSKLGLSARELGRLSENNKPAFSEIWDKNALTYECAKKLLGVANSKCNYEHIVVDQWRSLIEREEKISGLKPAIATLTTGMVVKAQQRFLMRECEEFTRLLNEYAIAEKRFLVAASRSERDYEVMYEQFRKNKKHCLKVLKDWEIATLDMQSDFDKELQKSVHTLQKFGDRIVKEAVDKAEKAKDSARLLKDSSELAFDSVGSGKKFFRCVQESLDASLVKLKQQYLFRLQDLASKSLQHQNEKLLHLVDASVRGSVQLEVVKDMVADGLSTRDSVDSVVLSAIRTHAVSAKVPISKAVRRVIWPFGAKAKYVIMREGIMDVFHKHVVNPYLEALKDEGGGRLTRLISENSTHIRGAIQESLREEELRYEQEKSQIGLVPKERIVASVTKLANFLAAGVVARRLKERLKVL